MSYLKPDRLGDVIAALQVMGTNERAEDTIEGWARKFDDPVDASSTARWKAVFKEHPEFFKIYVLKDQEKAALRWRYARRYFDHKQNTELTPEEAAKLPEQQRWLLTGKVLSDGQLQGLIDTAIELYSKAMTAQQEKRWALTLFVPAVSGLAGMVVGALLQHFLTK
ncbi:MAG: hypothetical protein C0484_02530 [Rhodospirillum sp.]|nr:hypothetical protein [Rhodospirillum sp.]